MTFSSAQTLNLPDTLESVTQIVVVSSDGRTPAASGSAFFVAENRVVSAAHVYWGLGTAINNQRGGSMLLQKFSLAEPKAFRVGCKLIVTDDEHDLALFEVDVDSIKKQWPDFKIKPLMLSHEKPIPGDRVVFVGYFGYDQFPMATSGMLAGFSRISLAVGGTADDLLLDRNANQGESGGPVLLERTGNVIGVLTVSVPAAGAFPAGFPAPPSGVSRATDAQYVVKLLGGSNGSPLPK